MQERNLYLEDRISVRCKPCQKCNEEIEQIINEKLKRIEIQKKEYIAKLLTKDKLPQLIGEYKKKREETRKYVY